MPNTAVIIRITTRPGQRAALRARWDEHLRARVEQSPAQALYLVVEDAADLDTLHLVEVYTDPAAMDRNAQAPWFAAYLAAVAPLLAGQPVMATGDLVWAKGAPV